MPQISNGELSDLLERHGRLLEISGESPFRVRAYTRAAEELRLWPERVAIVAAEGRLREIPGVGEGIAAAIAEILASGTFAAHIDLTRRFPETLIDLIAIPGVGPKTVRRIYSDLGIDNLPALEAAVISGHVRTTKGLGARAEATLRAGIEALQRRTGRTPLGVALPIVRSLLAAYRQTRPQDELSLAGSARRWDDTVGDLDIVVGTAEREASVAAFSGLPAVTSVDRISDDSLRALLAGGLQADAYFTDLAAWGSTLVRATGNAAHLERLGAIPGRMASEEAVYAAHGLPWIPPELRAGGEEFDRWAEIPALVTLADINGEFHAHTTWSDGAASIREMAAAAAARGYTFLGITDHSHGLGIAGGLDLARLGAQRLEINAAGGSDGIDLLAGAEVEVHRDGSLDFDAATLAALDVVVASLHTGLRQPRDELTGRLLRVLEDPNVDIIAHPSGRLIERREGGDFDWPLVFATAARTGTALEINADPARLDLDATHARRACDTGCLITINSDAHHPSGFAVMEYGVMVARKAWLKPDQILNCWPRPRVLSWLSERKKSA